jgi:hypothetical protein
MINLSSSIFCYDIIVCLKPFIISNTPIYINSRISQLNTKYVYQEPGCPLHVQKHEYYRHVTRGRPANTGRTSSPRAAKYIQHQTQTSSYNGQEGQIFIRQRPIDLKVLLQREG